MIQREPSGRAIRFVELTLDYGRHARSFELDSGVVPLVVLGPNGSGKSSLIEGLVRTLYGFQRARREDREAHDRRRPWEGGAYAGRLILESPRGRWTVERDFDTDQVRVTLAGKETPLFEAEANPAGSGEAALRYRRLLEEAVGLSELDAYRLTACIFQGTLPGTSLSLDLLRLAAGGHADIATAQERLKREYQGLTLEPIAPAVARRRTPGAVESSAGDVARLETQAREASAAERKRGPLVRARDDGRRRLRELSGDMERLDEAFETFSEAARLEEAADRSRARIRSLERAGREVDEALARFELLVDRERTGAAPEYPIDFPERARALEEGLWPRLGALELEARRLEDEPSPALRSKAGLLPGVAAALAVAAAVAWLGGAGGLGGLSAGLSVAALLVWLALGRADTARAEAREGRSAALAAERADVLARIDELLAGIPHPTSLTPETLPVRRAEFEREAADRALRDDAERALRGAMDAGATVWADVIAGEGESREGAPPGGLGTRARALLSDLRDAASTERDESLAPLKVRLQDIARVKFDLPADVEATVDGVREARRRRNRELDDVRAELTRIERELLVEARPAESAAALERRLEAARHELAALRARARAYRTAHRLVTEAYAAFRQTDEERLLGAISSRLSALSARALGPLDASEGLDRAQVGLGGRLVPMAAPPLSYGQLHTALLAVRLGAADFLAGLGVAIPLLIDDPFVHLDERGARDLWDVLARIAGTRQVIVATQDRLLLRHLGVEPDLVLEVPRRGARPGVAVSARAASNGGGPPHAEPAEESEATGGGQGDLWGRS